MSEEKATTDIQPIPRIFDLNKYNHHQTISRVQCSSNNKYQTFGAPTGICASDNDQLLVANFDYNALYLMDINGVIHQVYEDLPTPKDVVINSSNSSQAFIATKKEITILDLNTSQVVSKSKIPGFYPWNMQYLPDVDLLTGMLQF